MPVGEGVIVLLPVVVSDRTTIIYGRLTIFPNCSWIRAFCVGLF
jgi:hypothetical protein